MADTGTVILPPSLVSLFKTQQIPILTVKTETDPLVKHACALAKLPLAKKALEGAADLVLTRLRGRGGGKGIGMLVSATKLGCEWGVPFLSQRVVTTELTPLALPTPGPKTTHAKLNESVSVTRDKTLHFDVAVLDVSCVASTATLVARPGYALIAAHVQIESFSDGLDYDAAYWDLTTDGVNAGYFVPASDRPYVPYLTYGPLQANEHVQGWLMFHVETPTRSIQVMYRGTSASRVPVMQVDLGVCLNM